MQKILKSRIFQFILTAVLFSGISTYAAIKIQASEIGYKGGNVETALNDLYDKANAKQTVCMLLSGTANTLGAKYHCDLGDGVLRNFYVLKVNTEDVELIMEKNITDEILVNNSKMLSWNDAIVFFDEGNPGYTTKQAWTNIISVDLPSAQDIADAANITGWNYDTATKDNWSYFGVNSTSDPSKTSNYTWLYNYTRGCSSGNCNNGYPDSNGYPYGYWTKDLVQNDSDYAFEVLRLGNLGSAEVTNANRDGIRPVIKVYKSNLAG